MDIQEQYTEYAFIMQQNGESEARCSEAKIEASTKWLQPMKAIIHRSYEETNWYLVVFKPYDKAYEKDKDWFAVKGLDSCRKLFKKPEAYILTREVNASKIHVNAIVATKIDMSYKHDKTYCNRYKIHVSQLRHVSDRISALDYITKESKDRTFVKYLDYLHSK